MASKYRTNDGIVVEAFQHGIDPTPPWFTQWCREQNFEQPEICFGHYVILNDIGQIITYDTESFELIYEPDLDSGD